MERVPPRPLLRLAFFVVLAGVTALSLAPNVGTGYGGNDKVAHVVAYAVLGFLLVAPLRPQSTARRWIGATVLLVVYGCVIELAQQLTGRELEALDMAANALGAFSGGGIARVCTRGRPTRRSE
ncbi:MAG: VanZ family protein [Spirochaetota bacterium]